jgi:hypothetical protein
MNFKHTLILFFLPVVLLAQDPHNREALPVEKLLEKNNATQFRAIQDKKNFLVIDHLRTGKRQRFYKGDVFRFKTKEGLVFQDELVEISDSTFTIIKYDESVNHLEYFTFKFAEIERYYKRPVRKGIRSGLSWASFAALMPLAYDWAYFKIEPWRNPNAVKGILIVQGALTLIQNRNKFFNSRKFNDNIRLKSFKSL